MTLKVSMQYVQMMTLSRPWLFYGKVKFGPLCFCVGKKGKTMDFSETIIVYDLKLATDDRSDKTFLLTSKLCPLGGCMPPAAGLYTLNHEKNCIKSDSKEISLFREGLSVDIKILSPGAI